MPDLIKDNLTNTYKTTLGTEADEVIIGDPNSPDTFKPEIKFNKWKIPQTGEYENSLTIKPLFDIPNATTSLVGNKIEHKGDKIGWYCNPDGTENMKFGIILYEKPATNVFQFQLEGWEEFDFFYQRPWENYEEVEFTKEQSPFGVAGIHYKKLDEPMLDSIRLVETQGGYVVYHKAKRDYVIGQTNYQTGKIGSIYRPRLLDTNGNFLCWVDLQIKDGLYTLTVDQKILDTAKYPLKFNDIFGYNETGNNSYTQGSDMMFGTQYALAVSGDITKVTLYARGVTANRYFDTGIYSNTSNYPINRLAGGTQGILVNTTPTWYDSTLSYSFTAATYWLISGIAAGFTYYWDDSTGFSVYGFAAYYSPLTTPFPSSLTTATLRFTFYATYTPAGGAAALGIMTTRTSFWGDI